MLTEITIVLAVAIFFVALGKRFGLPNFLGYLLTGLIVGPSVFNFLPNIASSNLMYQYGSIVFMFCCGFMLRPTSLAQLSKSFILFIGLQFALTTLSIAVLVWLFFQTSIIASISIGCASALSSTAIILLLLQKNQLVQSQFGQNAALILMVQSVLAIILVMLMPIFAGQHNPHNAIGYFAAIVTLCSGLYLFNRHLLQPILTHLLKIGAKELISVTTLCVLVAVILAMQALEIHALLGAFLTGMILADSRFKQLIETQIEPFQDFLIGLLFIAIGLSLDIKVLAPQWIYILIGAFLLVIIKCIIITAIAVYQKQKISNGIKLGLLFAQGGEFTLLLLTIISQEQFITASELSILQASILSSMLISLGLYLLYQYFIEPKLNTERIHQQTASNAMSDHLIIAGFGRFGQIVARVANLNDLNFKVIDNALDDAEFIDNYHGEYIYGDAKVPDILTQANIAQASLFILAIDDIEDSMHIARYISLHYPHLTLFARARDRHHAYLLQELGIQHIWRETYASALEIAEHALIHYGFSADKAKDYIQHFDAHDKCLLGTEISTYSDSNQFIQHDQTTLQVLEMLIENDEMLKQREANNIHLKSNDTESTQMPDITP